MYTFFNELIVEMSRSSRSKLSEYERLRADNIARNQAFLDSLGLQEVKPRAPKRSKADSSDESDDYNEDEDSAEDNDKKVKKTKKRRAVRRSKKPEVLYPKRRSSRGLAREKGDELAELGNSESARGNYPVEEDEDFERKKVTVVSLRDHIDGKNEQHSEEISNEAIRHCCLRLSGMSEKALLNRAKAIARASGKNVREKLLVFMYALEVAGLDDLAEGCRTAVRKLPAP